MRKGRASRTAEHNALFRALETSLPAEQRLFADPLARRFLSPPYALVARLAALPGLRRWVPGFIDRRWPGVRSSLVARTRLIDDWIAEVAAAPIGQLVILGAGFDTRAYRLPGLEDLPAFEVDHPDTQAAKRRILERSLPALPERVRFVACDFGRDDLGSVMDAAGWRASTPALLLWEGVTGYLTADAVDATLRWCARAAPGSRLIFTYLHRDILDRPEHFVGSDRVLAVLERAGETLRFGIEPAELPAFLAERGLFLERDLGAAQYREMHFGKAARRMRGHEFYRVALAKLGAGV